MNDKPDLPLHLAKQLLQCIADLEQQYARKYNFAHITIVAAQTLPPVSITGSCYENSTLIFASMLHSVADDLQREPDEVTEIDLMEH